MPSPAQESLWYLSRLNPDSPANTVQRAYRVSGAFDVAAMRTAWRQVCRRHESLRTTLGEEAGRPVLRVSPDWDAQSFTVLSSPPSPWPEPAAHRLCVELAAVPFDLATGPLARMTVAWLDRSEHLVLVSAHESIVDERSMRTLIGEIAHIYSAVVEGRAPDGLAGLPLQYTDYLRWQRDQEGSAEYRQRLDWWTAALRPVPPPLDLPADGTRSAGPASPGGALKFNWGARLSTEVAGLAAATGTTPYMVLLAGLNSLLRRYGDSDPVTVGIPMEVRPRPSFAGVVGQFTNILPVCCDFSGRPGFREVLARTAQAVGAAHAHRDLPFVHLIRALDLERDPLRVPLADALFVFEDEVPGEPGHPEPRLDLPGASTARRPIDHGSVHADLTLVVERAEPVINGQLRYRNGLLAPSSAQTILDQLRTLLGQVAREPDLPAHSIPLEDHTRARVAMRRADRRTDHPAGLPVHKQVRVRARRHPEAAAIVADGATVTYRGLVEQATVVTAALRAGGEVAGSPVVVRMPPGRRQVAAVLAVLEAGAHVVCMGTADAGERGKAMLSGPRPACLVVDGLSATDRLAAWFREQGGRILDLSTVWDSAPPEATFAPGGGFLEDRAYIAYTSGSSGRPKGIPQTHEALAQLCGWLAHEFGLGPGVRMAQWAAPGYDAALCEIFAALVSGATLCPVPDRIRAHPEKLADWLAAERINVLQTVPSFARELLAVIDQRGSARRYSALSHLLLAGERLPAELAAGLRTTLPWTRLANLYGPSETILATWHEVGGTESGTVPIGRSIPGRQVLVVDDDDRPCPPGVTGHIVVRSRYATAGYLSGGPSTAFRPLRGMATAIDTAELGQGEDRTYRTGDLGRRRFDGVLEFRGRGDSQVKFHGSRLELGDVETALAGHPSVAECVVTATTDADGLVTGLVAYVVAHDPDEGAPADVLRAELRRRFGRAIPPVSITGVPALPRNLGGKLDRHRLPEAAPVPLQGPRPPATAMEREIAVLWAELGADHGGRDDTFFASGGHSLQVPRLLHRIRDRFGVEVTLGEFFAAPTLAGLSGLVSSHSVPNADS